MGGAYGGEEKFIFGLIQKFESKKKFECVYIDRK
jgi:hypothetical protein